jgi:hypothetical protein
MSLFISQENQNLLYEMINKTPEINQVFSNVDEKNRWFRRMIELQYDQLPKNITREVLLATNRQILSSMVTYLRSAKPPLVNIMKRDNNANIEQIQSQYKSMFEVPKPQTIDFSEKMDDDVITNMAELIENQKKMRERELQEYSPPPPSQNSSQNSSQNLTQKHNTKINILEDIPKDVLKPVIDRRVQFEIDSYSSPIDLSFTEINKITEINNKIDRLEEKLDRFINLFQNNQLRESVQIAKTNESKSTESNENISILKQLINQVTE